MFKSGGFLTAVHHKHSVLSSRAAQGRFAPRALQQEMNVRRSGTCHWEAGPAGQEVQAVPGQVGWLPEQRHATQHCSETVLC